MTDKPKPRLIDRDKLWDMFCFHDWKGLEEYRDVILSEIVGLMTSLPNIDD